MRDLIRSTAAELVDRFARREISPRETTAAVLSRVEELNAVINAFITVTPELALAQAKAAERLYLTAAPEDLPPLLGVPLAIKDTLATAGIRTTRGSLLHADWIPSHDAIAVERVRAAGAVILGKTNTSEFGWKADSGNRLVGGTRNPWNLHLTAGGSSGGSAAAVAAELGPLALGTDAGGSIRVPAALSGVISLKPSHGRVPIQGSGAIGSLAHHGPIGRTVTDVSLLFDVLAGYDPRDRRCLPLDSPVTSACLADGVRGLRIAWAPTLGYGLVEPEVADIASALAARLSELGAEVELVTPELEDPHWMIWTLFASAAAAQHASDFDRVRDLMDPGRASLVEHGLQLTAANMAAAEGARDQLYRQILALMDGFDLLLTPTTPTPAFSLQEYPPRLIAGRPTGDGLSWSAFSYPFNLTGQPAASVPCGLTSSGLPVGLQVVGRPQADATVLRGAAAIERLRPWMRPPLTPTQDDRRTTLGGSGS